MSKDLKHIPILCIDVKEFGKRNLTEQRTILRRLQKITTIAAKFFMPHGNVWEKWKRQGTGDGYYFMFDGLSTQVALKYTLNINDELCVYNKKHGLYLPIRLRMVLVLGDVELVDDQYLSEAFTEAERFISHPPFKKYLKESDNPTVLAISALFYSEWLEDPARNNPEIEIKDLVWTPFDFRDKDGYQHKGYVLGSGWTKVPHHEGKELVGEYFFASKFENILNRLFEDQELDDKALFYGQFAKTRSPEERKHYQKDNEPLSIKPQFYMTFTAVQTLLYLNHLHGKQNLLTNSRLDEIITQYSEEISHRISLAGDFTERLLDEHNKRFNLGNRIVMQGDLYHPGNYISYRHTIGATIILFLLNRQHELVEDILTELVTKKIQNEDFGWPIIEKSSEPSDFLCSAHLAFLFYLILQEKKFKRIQNEIKSKLDTTMAYLLLENYKNGGLWKYSVEADKVPFTARTYPELFNLLKYYNYDILYEIPSSLINFYPVDLREKFEGVETTDQLHIRLAYVFRFMADTQPEPYLQKYLEIRKDILSTYRKSNYYSTYELCCLLTMIIDQIVPLSKQTEMKFVVADHSIENNYFVGKVFSVSDDEYFRLKQTKLIS